jgi:hypothetical protein
MANNRIFIKCPECGEETLLMKAYSEWQIYDVEILEMFIKKHNFCVAYRNFPLPFEFSAETTIEECRDYAK